MFRVTSLTKMDDRQLNRLIKRVLLLLVLGTIAFVSFYALDRWRPATTPIIDQRLAALEQAVRDRPDDIASRGLLADTYVAKGRYEDAIVQYNLILETGKADELAQSHRAGAYMGLGQLDAAAKDYQAVVDIASGGEMANVDPMLQAAYYSLGSIAMQQGRPGEAITQLEKALAIKRSDADALYLIGTAFVVTGETGKAETALRAAVAFVPIGWSEPYVALADGFTKAGKTAEAEWAGAMANLVAGKPELAEPRLLRLSTASGRGRRDRPGLLYERARRPGVRPTHATALEKSSDGAARLRRVSAVAAGTNRCWRPAPVR
jgi:tetratricopeptide (TPR) repeat protein